MTHEISTSVAGLHERAGAGGGSSVGGELQAKERARRGDTHTHTCSCHFCAGIMSWSMFSFIGIVGSYVRQWPPSIPKGRHCRGAQLHHFEEAAQDAWQRMWAVYSMYVCMDVCMPLPSSPPYISTLPPSSATRSNDLYDIDRLRNFVQKWYT